MPGSTPPVASMHLRAPSPRRKVRTVSRKVYLRLLPVIRALVNPVVIVKALKRRKFALAGGQSEVGFVHRRGRRVRYKARGRVMPCDTLNAGGPIHAYLTKTSLTF